MRAHPIRATLAAGLLLAGCTPGGPSTGEEPVGELIGSWDADSGHTWLTGTRPQGVLLAHEWHLNEWSSSAGADLPELEAIDYSEYAVVLAFHDRCEDETQVYLDRLDAERLLARTVLVAAGDLDCEAPNAAAQAWAIDRAELDGGRLVGVSSAPAPAEPAEPQPVGSALSQLWDENVASAEDLEVIASKYPLVRTAREQQELIRALQAVTENDVDAGQLAAVDIGRWMIVVTGFHRCADTVSWHADLSRDPVALWSQVESDPDIVCAWAPYTLEFWRIPVQDVGESVELVQHAR